MNKHQKRNRVPRRPIGRFMFHRILAVAAGALSCANGAAETVRPWIKITHDLPYKTEVCQIADKLNCDPTVVVGALVTFWIWADNHNVDGEIRHASVTLLSRIERDIGVTGFMQSLIEVGWLIEKNGCFYLPNYDRHHSESAKKRALASARQNQRRFDLSRFCHASSVTKSKSKIKKHSPPISPPKGGVETPDSRKCNDPKLTQQALEIYTAYPLHRGKKKGLEAIVKALKKVPFETLMAAVKRYAESPEVQEHKRLREFGLIKMPQGWFNDERWTDEVVLGGLSPDNPYLPKAEDDNA